MKNANKKMIAALLAAIMILTVLATGCGNDPSETTAPETTLTPETTPSETPESTPESTPSESPESTPSVTPESIPSTEPESTPDQVVEYSITYDLDGGIDGGNPTSYSNVGVIFYLDQPIKPGYDFAGWTGTGLTEPTKDVKIDYSTKGDLFFKATWTENKTYDNTPNLDETYFGKDDGLTANTEELGVSTTDRLGGRGEGLHTLKTVYTDISVDGTMDAAYTYGLHFTMDLTTNDEFYAERETTFDAYIIRGQNGLVYVYVEVVDPDIVVNEYIFKNDGEWRVDSIDMYVEIGNYGHGHVLYSFVPDMTGALRRKMPALNSIKLTDTGYAAEFALDNNGAPFYENDELGFGFYLNDANNWNPETKSYRKDVAKNASALNPVGTAYLGPAAHIHDALVMSHESASGKVVIEDDSVAQTGDIIADIANGSASVAIVYDNYATTQSIYMLQELSALLRNRSANVYVVNESKSAISENCDYKILVNMTSHKESADLISSLALNEYAVSITKDAIAVVGWNEDAAAAVYDILYEVIDHGFGGGTSTELGSLYKGKLDSIVGEGVPVLDGMYSITDVGENAYMMYALDSTVEAYNAYLAKLEAAGFTLYTSNTIASAQFATYCNANAVINVEFGGENDKSLRVVVDPIDNSPLPSTSAPEDAESEVAVPSITQMYPHNLCLVIQLSNGHFVIIDSGNNGTQRELSDFLRSMAPDKNNVVIEAWIFTHFHQDHLGGFIDYMMVSSLTRYITVESVIYNFPQWQALNTASSKDIDNLKHFYNTIKPQMQANGTVFYQARTGQKYYFGNAVIEILWTFDDMAPFNVFSDITNCTDIGFTVTIEGQKIMITGDSTEDEFRMAANKYGDTLKSDMVQLAHHGSGNGGGSHDFYKLVDAPIVFHPRVAELNSSTYTPGANEIWAINNAELVIRSGNYGTATLKLPFTIGDEIESTKTPVDELGKNQE